MVAGLDEPSAANRNDVYHRARAALDAQFDGGLQPDAAAFTAERDALEDAIARVEAEYPAGALPPARATVPPVDERRRFAFNAAAGGISNLAKIGVQLVLLPVMARLLGPAEFGLYALALPTIVFFTTLADGGLGASLARENETSTTVWSTAFWALLASCIFLALVTIGSGFALAAWSEQPRLAGLMALLSLSFPLLALTSLPAARLVRRGNLVLHSVADLASTLIGASVAVTLATLGAGAWALATQYVLGWVVTCAVLNAAAFERPTWEFQLSSLKAHAATGGSLIFGRLGELLGRQAENLVFGRMFGAVTLGSYTFAGQTSRFLSEAASNPVWGALYSHALRATARDVAPLHSTLSRLLASALFPMAALLTASAPPLFDVVLGPRWAFAAVLVQIMLPSFAANAVATQCGAIMLANGRNARLFWLQTGLSLVRLLAVLIGAATGPVGVAWGIAAANFCYAAAMFASLGGTTGTSTWPLVRQLVPSLIASAVAGVVCRLLIVARPENLSWTITALALGGCVFVACLSLLQGRRLMADAVAIRRIVFSRL